MNDILKRFGETIIINSDLIYSKKKRKKESNVNPNKPEIKENLSGTTVHNEIIIIRARQ